MTRARDTLKPVWRQLLRDLHYAGGLAWIAIGRRLACYPHSAREFANYDPLNRATERGRYPNTRSLAITWERGDWIMRAHRALCADHSDHLQPILDAAAPLPSAEAVQRIIEREG